MKEFFNKNLKVMLSILLILTGVLVTGCNEKEKQEEKVLETFVVTFDTNGGTEVASQSVKEGERIQEPVTTKEGYELVGWKYNGTSYNFNSSVTSNMTLKAEWAKKEEVWVVTLDKQNGSTTRVNVKKGETLEKPVDPTKEGYVFVSWQYNGKDYDFSKVVESDITLTATYKEKLNKVTFDSNGGTSVKTQELKVGAKATKPSNPTKSGWTFVEWQFEGTKYDFSKEVTSDITLVAIYKLAKTYTKEESMTKKINGKNTKIDFRVAGSGANTSVDIFVSDIKAHTINIEVGDIDNCSGPDKICVSDVKDAINEFKKLQIIKGDKEYFLLQTVTYDIIVISDAGVLVYNKNFDKGGANPALIDNSCKNYDKFSNGEAFYIANDAIYYLDNYTDTQAKQFKVTFSKNKATTTTVATCIANILEHGSGGLHIITETKKVAGKTLNLEYVFSASASDDCEADLCTIEAQLSINNKAVDDEIYRNIFEDNVRFNAVIGENIDNVANMVNYWKNVSNKLGNDVGIIKGDKEYLYVKKNLQGMTGNDRSILIFNESGTKIYELISEEGRWIRIEDPSSPIYNKYSDLEHTYIINSDSIYSLELTFSPDNGDDICTEYKITFSGNKATKTALAEYSCTVEGSVF